VVWLLVFAGCEQDARWEADQEEGRAAALRLAEPSLAEQASAVRSGRAHEIRVETRPVRDEDLAVLQGLTGLEVLQLDHPGNEVTELGLRNLGPGSGLKHVRIESERLYDPALATLAKLETLEIVNLPRGGFTDAGIGALRALPGLVQLRIRVPALTEEGVVSITKFPALRRLHLIDAPVGDIGLSELSGMEQLESLYLDGASVTEEGLKLLFRKRPDLHVHLDSHHDAHDPQASAHEHARP
jgi:hypothetical protein